MDIELIHFDLKNHEVTFRGEYGPTSGPLPTLIFRLTGLWTYKGIILKALFEANRLPVHNEELIFHRYEKVSQPGLAKYRYFTIPGAAGMVLSPYFYSKVGLPIEKICQHLNEEANRCELSDWLVGKPLEVIKEYTLIEVPDLVGNFPPMLIYLSYREEDIS